MLYSLFIFLILFRFKLSSKFFLSLQYYLTVSLSLDHEETNTHDYDEAEINILPLLAILNNMRSDFSIQNELLGNIDEEKLNNINKKTLLNCKGNCEITQNFLEKIDLDHRGVQVPPKLDFSPAAELATSVLKINTRIENMSSVILDIDGQNIIYNKIGVSIFIN